MKIFLYYIIVLKKLISIKANSIFFQLTSQKPLIQLTDLGCGSFERKENTF